MVYEIKYWIIIEAALLILLCLVNIKFVLGEFTQPSKDNHKYLTLYRIYIIFAL